MFVAMLSSWALCASDLVAYAKIYIKYNLVSSISHLHGIKLIDILNGNGQSR